MADGESAAADPVATTDPVARERRTVAMTLRFRRWSRRDPLECVHCGAAVVNARQHASWHASIEAGARRIPDDPGMWSERRHDTEDFKIAVGDDGWPIP